jgi:hypothetical protein
MSNLEKLIVFDEITFKVGEKPFTDSTADNGNCVVFEEDEDAAFFYKVDRNNNLSVLDALHIYNVADILKTSKEIPSVIKIVWNEDGTKSFLYLNNYCHAVYDFNTNSGYCRNGLPELKKGWFSKKVERKLSDDILTELYKNNKI